MGNWFFNIFVDTKAIEKPQDVAGMTIRVMENDAYITYFQSWELIRYPWPIQKCLQESRMERLMER